MPFRKFSESVNWRSTAGELALIVVGVTIALAGTAWYEGLQDRQDEDLILQQLSTALRLDQGHLEAAREFRQRQAHDVRGFRVHMEEERPYSADLAFGTVLAWFGTRTNSAPYEALKSRGLELISDDALRIDLIRYYEDLFPLVENAYLNDRTFVMGEARPYYLEHFRQELDETGASSWTPLSYDSLQLDSYFWNITGTKLQRLEVRILPYLDDALTLLDGLLTGIDAQLQS